MYRKFLSTFSFLYLFLIALVTVTNGQVSQRATTVVTKSVNDADRVTLYGNMHPLAQRATDRGPVADDMRLDHLQLQLKRSVNAEEELNRYIEELHDPQSPNFHKWSTAAEFGEKFGLAQQDIEAVTNWLQAKGFTVNTVYPNLAVDFSGTAGQVREAFHTVIHNLDVNGAPHIANLKDPEIPAALADVVAGPIALHNFKPHPLSRPRTQYTVDANTQLVVPLDLQKIYNLTPLYGAGVSGQGQTIVVLEDTDLYSNGDWYAFRKTLGLARKYPLAKLKIVHPQPGPGGACDDPGVTIDDGEAAVDVEWASAAAPNATIELASCADTDTNFGGFIALQNLLSGAGAPPSVVSLSYGVPESENGPSMNSYINSLYQLAVIRGVSLFVASGDSGAAGSDQNRSAALFGISVSGYASTPNNVAVGGTDFGDAFLSENAKYWNNTNRPSYNSAKSYIPEIPWNDSCASQLISEFLGYAKPYGVDGFCNSSIGSGFLGTSADGGGPSGCALGAPNISGVVDGSCAGYRKPSFQRLVYGNPKDGVRDLPDVSLFAANGVWGHYYVICYSDPAGGGTPCDTPPETWAGGGGTSFTAPIMAGIQSLINQATGSAQGNPNFIYYKLAGSEYGDTGNSECNSTLGNAANPGCIFYDVTMGDMDVNCRPLRNIDGTITGKFNCFYPATNPGANGVLSTSNTSYKPAFKSKVGWDFATGIGTVNAYNLALHWPGSGLATAKRK
ncbi:MAG: S8/S53 family peptidase [Acidobacteriaceae bacterium]|nr:S8/S53 family peptidase [Acidobacteriaceae bacterium]